MTFVFSNTTARQARQWLPFAAAAVATAAGGALVVASTTAAPKSQCDNNAAQHANDVSASNNSTSSNTSNNRIVFLGTGSSTGCPMPRCPLLFSSSNNEDGSSNHKDLRLAEYQQLLRNKCRVSNLAGDPRVDPRHNRNYRCNPSLLISHRVQEDKDNNANTAQQQRNMVIDVGKTFRESSLRWFPMLGVQTLDAVVLTHEHADACFGLDDLRGFQAFDMESLREAYGTRTATESDNNKPKQQPKHHRRPQQLPMPLFLSQPCLDVVSQQFPWIFPNHQQQNNNNNKTPCSCQKEDSDSDASSSNSSSNTNSKPVVERHVASVDVNIFVPYQPFVAAGLKITPLPIMHGEDLVSFGFAFTVGNTHIVYLSDISRMLPKTLEFIQTRLPPTDVLIVDSLHPDKTHPVHYSLEQAVALSRTLRPRRQTLLVGMNCDSFAPHDEANHELQQLYPGENIQLAHDGLVIDC